MAVINPSGAAEVRRILEGACFNRELLILSTGRGRFESHFIAVDAGAIHVAPTMSGERTTNHIEYRWNARDKCEFAFRQRSRN